MEIKTITILPIILLIEGFVSIAIEILTIRQLLPVAGSSVIVTSLIIGFFLLFLAIGYWSGGRVVQNFLKRLRINFIVATLWMGIGLSYIFISLFFYFIQNFLGPHIIYPLILYLLFIISPLIYILGQTVPITMNLVRQNHSIGRISGHVLSLNTLGSFLGAVITSLLLMEYIGVAWTILANTLFMIIMIMTLIDNKKSFFITSFMMIITLWIVYEFNIKIENQLFERTNNYANYQIVENLMNPSQKMLSINNSASSFINEHNQGAEYIELIKKILFKDMQLRNTDILVLGAGGFTLSAESTYGNRFTYVDIDPNINKVAAPKFVKQINGDFIADDARHYILTTDKNYSVIIVDAYTNTLSIPSHLLTQEYIVQLQKRLEKSGVIIFNIISKPTLEDTYSKHIDNTIRSVFKNCMVIPAKYGTQVTNILYVCKKSENHADHIIYTDNLNPSTTESFEW